MNIQKTPRSQLPPVTAVAFLAISRMFGDSPTRASTPHFIAALFFFGGGVQYNC